MSGLPMWPVDFEVSAQLDLPLGFVLTDHAAASALIAQLQSQLEAARARLAIQGRIVRACHEHEGQPFTFEATVVSPLASYCPLCEQKAKP